MPKVLTQKKLNCVVRKHKPALASPCLRDTNLPSQALPRGKSIFLIWCGVGLKYYNSSQGQRSRSCHPNLITPEVKKFNCF